MCNCINICSAVDGAFNSMVITESINQLKLNWSELQRWKCRLWGRFTDIWWQYVANKTCPRPNTMTLYPIITISCLINLSCFYTNLEGGIHGCSACFYLTTLFPDTPVLRHLSKFTDLVSDVEGANTKRVRCFTLGTGLFPGYYTLFISTKNKSSHSIMVRN